MKTFYLLAVASVWLTVLQDSIGQTVDCRVFGWGYNVAGQATGIPNDEPPNTPNYAAGFVKIDGSVLTNVVAVAAGRFHSLALNSDGQVFGWGGNIGGKAAGYTNSYPNRANGPVRIGGQALNGITAIAAGEDFSLALKTNGTVVGWGETFHHAQIVPDDLSNVVSIAAGADYGLALKADGTAVSWGARKGVLAGVSNIVAIAAGGEYFTPALALLGDGTVVQWERYADRRDVPPEVKDIVAISEGDAHRLALKRDGTVIGWDSNQFGEATGTPTTSYPNSASGPVIIAGHSLSNVVAISAGYDFSLALKSDGRVIGWGKNSARQTDIPAGLSGVVAISAGEHFCLAITTNAASFGAKK